MKIRKARLEDLDRIVEIELEISRLKKPFLALFLRPIGEKFRPRFWLQKKRVESWGI